MKPTITEDEFRSALSDQFKRALDGSLTMREIAAHMGLGWNATMARVRAMIDAGKIEYAGKVRRSKITGEPCTIAAYRMVKKGGRK